MEVGAASSTLDKRPSAVAPLLKSRQKGEFTMGKANFTNVDEYISRQPETAQVLLQLVRRTLLKALPGTEKMISYKIPAYGLNGGDCAVLRWLEAALLVVPNGRAYGHGVQGPASTIQGQQEHNPFSALRASPREVDRAHREVPRGGSRPAREVKTSRLEEALGRRFWHCPLVARASHRTAP
jgi:hypothetical protein